MGSRLLNPWSLETTTFSSAKELYSPVSPPSSPTLYYQTSKNNSNGASIKSIGGPALSCNPGVLIGNGGKTLLSSANPLEYEISKTGQKMMGGVNTSPSDWILKQGLNEDDVNDLTDLNHLPEDSYALDLFDIGSDDFLDDSLSPASCSTAENSIVNESSISFVLAQTSTPATTSEMEAKEKEILDSEFHQLLQLPIFNMSEIEQLGAIPISSLDDETMCIGEEEDCSKNDVEVIDIDSDEDEEEDCDESSQYDSISQPSSVSTSSDVEDAIQDATLDALIRGDNEAAAAMYPSSSPAVKKGKAYARILSSGSRARRGISDDIVTTAALMMMPKPERRGRKPSAAAVGKPWIHLKDKNLRKKEQNKTAATRYRQKKKKETQVFLVEEQKLTLENVQLKGQVEELRKEISIIKGLLRTLYTSTKQKHLKRINKH